ncbi:hypothetical protein FLL45_19845 [Aliikangiella marina]|uniref:DUF91 domain-containing protein n=1 Tax=Aliikangiella marina TaxID=1712262 RepID=A0A545T2G8_9GAMM|nr:hypothetical protein [Aliikangiella marina]TQV71411.1 hypothetical protein FLL45_19845 [Aliikangiella marina]
MAIYKIADEQLIPVERTSFNKEGVLERQHLQQMLKSQIDIISPDTLLVAEEFGDWEDSRRRIDLLGIDKNANLVVIELKRTEDGGHMELQAIRYGAMISTLTFDKLVQIYTKYLSDNNADLDAKASLLKFLEWDEPDEDNFAQEVKVLLASAEFSKELTTSVIWLNDFGLDIRCVRMHPYINDGQLLLDIQTVIPVPETADYQVKIREKKQRERASRNQHRDTTKFDLTINSKEHRSLSKRWLVFQVIKPIIDSGVSPTEVQSVIDDVPERRSKLFEVFEGELDEKDLYEVIMAGDSGGAVPRIKRFFAKKGEFFHHNGNTFVLSNQWGVGALETIDALARNFSNFSIDYSARD